MSPPKRVELVEVNGRKFIACPYSHATSRESIGFSPALFPSPEDLEGHLDFAHSLRGTFTPVQ